MPVQRHSGGIQQGAQRPLWQDVWYYHTHLALRISVLDSCNTTAKDIPLLGVVHKLAQETVNLHHRERVEFAITK